MGQDRDTGNGPGPGTSKGEARRMLRLGMMYARVDTTRRRWKNVVIIPVVKSVR